MPAPEEAVLIVLREWLVKAENDLTAATQIIKMGKAAPMDTICFHAQQCLEKYLKAILVHRAIPVPRTRNIQALMKLVPPVARPGLTDDEERQLTNYAAVTRYPDAGLEISLAEARKALAIARRVRREVRRLLAEGRVATQEKMMEPWYKSVTPRKEVREGLSFNPDEFAIALEHVVAGTAPTTTSVRGFQTHFRGFQTLVRDTGALCGPAASFVATPWVA